MSFSLLALVRILDDPVNRGSLSSSSSFLSSVSISFSLSLSHLCSALLKSHLYASYERPSSAYSTFVYLYGSSIETSISRRCLPFTNNSKVCPFVNRSNLVPPFSSFGDFVFFACLPHLASLSHSSGKPLAKSANRETRTSASA